MYFGKTQSDRLFLPAQRQWRLSKAHAAKEVVVEPHDGTEEQPGAHFHLSPPDAVRGHAIAGVCSAEKHTRHQVRQLSGQRPPFRGTAPGAAETLAKRIKAVPTFLVF